jgi:hypothetical protein
VRVSLPAYPTDQIRISSPEKATNNPIINEIIVGLINKIIIKINGRGV